MAVKQSARGLALGAVGISTGVLGIWYATSPQPPSAPAEVRMASKTPDEPAQPLPRLALPAPVTTTARVEHSLPASEATSVPEVDPEQAALAEEEAYWSHPRFQMIAHLRDAPPTSPTGSADQIGRFAPWESRFLGAYFAQLDTALAGGSDADMSEAAGAMLARLVGKYAETELGDVRCTPALCRFEARLPDSAASRRTGFIRHLKATATQASNRATVHLPEGDDLLVGYVSQTEARLPPPARSFLEFMAGS